MGEVQLLGQQCVLIGIGYTDILEISTSGHKEEGDLQGRGQELGDEEDYVTVDEYNILPADGYNVHWARNEREGTLSALGGNPEGSGISFG